MSVINVGAAENDGNGETLRSAFVNVNNAFAQLQGWLSPDEFLPPGSVKLISPSDLSIAALGSNLYLSGTNVVFLASVVTLPVAALDVQNGAIKLGRWELSVNGVGNLIATDTGGTAVVTLATP